MRVKEELVRRAREYTQRQGLPLGEAIGFGVHGIVFIVESQPETGQAPVRSAVKVHQHGPDYCRERDVYLRLKELGLQQIRGCEVPRLLRYDNELLVLEMSVVSRPYVLDFAGAFLDYAPDFSEEVLADWRTEKQEQFGARWPEVQAILGFLEGHGIFLIDVHPNNIAFGD